MEPGSFSVKFYQLLLELDRKRAVGDYSNKMPSDIGERMAKVETDMDTTKADVERHRKHIGELLTFKGQLEGGMTMMKYMTGGSLLTSLVMLAKLFLG